MVSLKNYFKILMGIFAFSFFVQELFSQKISADSIKKHLFVLGHDSLSGRGTGTKGCEKAAHYIRENLRSFGIAAAPKTMDYFQTFPLHGSKAQDDTEFKLYAPKDSYALGLQEDYVLYSGGAQTFIASPVAMIFVGYGIVAPEFDYNDYQNLDVQNAIVVFLTGEPRSNDQAYFNGDQLTEHSSFVLKQKIALSRGAKGSILLPNPNDRTMDDWYEQQRHFLFEEVRLLASPSENLNILLNPKLVPFLFTDGKYTFEEITAFDKMGIMRSFPLSLRASFQGKFLERDFLTSNLIGMVEGSDPSMKESYLLLSAHYDHLGVGKSVEGDSIYNGVVDNASGVAALLEIARSFATGQYKPKRSIVFVFLTGEERGFLGSQYYANNPVVPLYKTVANINIDGLSIFERIKSVIGVGAELSTLGSSLMTAISPLSISVEKIPQEKFRPDQFRNSDQFIFAQAGIPSILIAEGLSYETIGYNEGVERFLSWVEDRYHTPYDDLNQNINFDAAAQHTEIIRQLSEFLANTETIPTWNKDSPFLNARLRSIAEKK